MQGKELTVRENGHMGPVAQADNDNQVVTMWLHGRPTTPQRAYTYEVRGLLATGGKPLHHITLGDLQSHFFTLQSQAPASRARAINAVKSLFSFVQRIGYLTFNPAAAVQGPKVKNTLAQRILPETQVHLLLALEPHPRNRILLWLMYAAGLRVSEACGLKWREVQEREEGAGQITVYAKGGKTRVVLLFPETWAELISLKGEGGANDPVFASRKGKSLLHPSQVKRIIQVAAERAGIEAPVSPHWLRHADASHALDRVAPTHLVQAHHGSCFRRHHGQVSPCPA